MQSRRNSNQSQSSNRDFSSRRGFNSDSSYGAEASEFDQQPRLGGQADYAGQDDYSQRASRGYGQDLSERNDRNSYGQSQSGPSQYGYQGDRNYERNFNSDRQNRGQYGQQTGYGASYGPYGQGSGSYDNQSQWNAQPQYGEHSYRSPSAAQSPGSSYTDEDYGSVASPNQSNWNQRTRNTPSFNSGSYNSTYDYDQAESGRGGSISFGSRSQSSFGPTGKYHGVGPKGYKRSDERIKEEICDMLTHDSTIDAADIDVEVKDGEVTLSGTVSERGMKHMAEQVADRAQGVKDIHNQLKVKKQSDEDSSTSSKSSSGTGKKSASSTNNPAH